MEKTARMLLGERIQFDKGRGGTIMRRNIYMILVLLLVTLVGCQSKDNETEKEVESKAVGESKSKVKQEKLPKNKLTYLEGEWKEIGQYSEGLIPVQDKKTGFWGYVDKTGKYQIEPSYYDAYPFSEGLAAVKGDNGFYSFIDKEGKTKISGNYSDVYKRFCGGLEGFEKELAVLSDENAAFHLIDKSGNIIKTLDASEARAVQLENFIDKGEIITRSDVDSDTVFDTQYNAIASWKGYNESMNGCRDLFNLSTKYLIFDIYDEGIEGVSGLYAVDKDKQIVFSEETFEGEYPELEFDFLGLTDEYIVTRKVTNGIVFYKVYDYDANLIMESSEYKNLIPLNEELFLVQNQADLYAIVDKNQKEYVPFAEFYPNNTHDSSGDLGNIATDIKTRGYMYYSYKDEMGNSCRKYFELSTKEIKDAPEFTYENGTTLNGFQVYDRLKEDSEVFYNVEQYEISVFDTKGHLLGTIDRGDSRERVSNLYLFLENNIIPVINENRTGKTLAVVE